MITNIVYHQSSGVSAAPSSLNEKYSGDEEPEPQSSGSVLKNETDDEEPPDHFLKFKTSPLISDKCRVFRDSFFPGVSDENWNSWQWQFSSRIRTLSGLERLLRLTEGEKAALMQAAGKLPVSVTPYYASLLEPDNPEQPLRRTVIPVPGEFHLSPGESSDPLHEETCCRASGLYHRYPDRVLFLSTNICSVNCRYCTRSRVVGNRNAGLSRADWDQAIVYISEHPEVRDVLISGGDPLTMTDESLEYLISRLRKISHVEIIRLGTKVPMVLPQRITAGLVKMLRKYHPLWMSIHCTHPEEITTESAEACRRLADAGIPLGSQTVLLKGINDRVEILTSLFQNLMKIRVKPYYLYQCDPIAGSAHFRTTLHDGVELIRGIRGFTSGYAVPHYVVDAPGGGGKIPLSPDYIQGLSDDSLILKNYEGRLFAYPDNSLDGGHKL